MARRVAIRTSSVRQWRTGRSRQAHCGQERLLMAIQCVVVVVEQPPGGAPHRLGMGSNNRVEIAHGPRRLGKTGERTTCLIVAELSRALQARGEKSRPHDER